MSEPQPKDSVNLRALRFVVVCLGIALAGGFVMLFAVIAKKLDAPKEAGKESVKERAELCPAVSPELPVYTQFRILEQQGDVTALLLEGDGLTHILRVDNCTGRTLSHLKLGQGFAPPVAAAE